MIKRIPLALTICLGMLASCNLTEELSPVNPDDVTFYATNGDKAPTRTILLDNGAIEWLPKDEITLFYGVGNSVKLVSSNDKQAGSVEFKGTIPGFSLLEDAPLWAVYPYREDNDFYGKSVSITLPAQQAAYADTFADDLFVSIARTTDYSLHFYNVCGGIKFRVTEQGVKTVTFQGNNGEQIAGTVRVGFGEDGKPSIQGVIKGEKSITLTPPDGSTFKTGSWYYIAVLPVSLQNGYKITLFKGDGTSTVKRSNAAVNVKRAIWGRLDNLDNGLEYKIRVPDNEIWYTTTDGEPIGISADVMASLGIASNEYEDGMGRIVFNRETYAEYPIFKEAGNLESVQLPESVTMIGWECFSGKESLVMVDMPGVNRIRSRAFSRTGLAGRFMVPEGVEIIEDGAFGECPYLTELVIPESVKKMGFHIFDDTPLKRLEMKPLVPPLPVMNPDYYFYDPVYDYSVTYESSLINNGINIAGTLWKSSGLIIVPENSIIEYQESDYWKYALQFLTTEGKLPSDHYYSSTDYSRDGEVVVLQQATIGHGVNLVFLADGYVDRDLEPGGRYEQRLQLEVSNFFKLEPYKSLRNRFNVYQVNVVSKNNLYMSPYSVRAFTKDTKWNAMDCFDSAALEYAHKTNATADDPLFIVVLRNQNYYGAADFCDSFVESGALAYCFDRSDSRDSCVVAHEMGGHGIGRLGDEYMGLGLYFTESQRAGWDEWVNRTSYSLNIDWRSDPETVHWSHFLKDSRYSEEGLGVFEGGGVYQFGMYRCSEESVMNGTGPRGSGPSGYSGWFNAPSRECIYKRVMKLSEGSDWEYDYETFVEFDAAGREQAAAKYKIWQVAYEKFWSVRDNSVTAAEPSPINLSKYRK
jgi:hypothetical protein